MPSLAHVEPATVSEVLSTRMTFTPQALAAVRALARSKPWKGSESERIVKLNAAAGALADAYGHAPYTVHRADQNAIDPLSHVLFIHRLSVVSFLHLMAHARGLAIRNRYRWSINIFRRCFPISYSRCTHDGPLLTRPDLYGPRPSELANGD